MAVYPGRNGVIYLGTSAGGVATNVIHLSSWSMDRSTDTIEVTSFGDSNKTYVQGLPNISVNFTGFWDDTETKPFAAAGSAGAVNMYLYPSSSIAQSSAKYAYGTAWVNCSISTDVGGAVQINGTAVAAASWFVGF